MLCYFHHCWINIKWNIYLIIKPLGITRDYLGLTILKDSALHVPPVLWNSLRAVYTHFLQKIRRHKKPHGRQDARLMSCNQYKLAPAKDKSNTQEKNIWLSENSGATQTWGSHKIVIYRKACSATGASQKSKKLPISIQTPWRWV